jgi:restriction system protein
MAVPDFQSFFRPLLEIAGDGKEHSMSEARAIIAKNMNLSESDLAEMLGSGKQSKFENRVAWAKSYFTQAKVLEAPRRGCFKITDRGVQLLNEKHDRIDVKILNKFPEFVEFHTAKSDKGGAVDDTSDSADTTETPEESLEKAYQSIRNDLSSAVLAKVKTNTPKFFENLVIDLMISLGYGGSRKDAGKSIGQSGDEGIDGIIKEDMLGLDVIYIQAKRWEGTVGRPDIQKFVGALHGKRAKKGVFITTGKFSQDAVAYVETIDPKVILIDGRQLAELMIDHNLGVSTSNSYEIKKMDSDYFDETE